MNLIQHQDAELEVIDAVDYYERQRQGLGMEFLDDVQRAYQTILAAPKKWARVTRNARRYRISRFPYGVVYQVRKDTVLVVAVMHLSRRPGYWRQRRFP